MANKQINARVALKHDTEANWITAGEHGFCPMAGEVIIYDIQEGVCSQLRYKVGRKDDNDQLININDLPFETNLYVGITEPVDVPVGFMWLDTSDEVKIISFNIEDRTIYPYIITSSYQAEEGMTFREWLNTDYNTLGFMCLQFDHYNGVPLPEHNEEDHIQGLGIVFYTDGTTGDGSDTSKSAMGEYVLSNVASPDMSSSIQGTGLTDCDELIINDYTYTLIAWP